MTFPMSEARISTSHSSTLRFGVGVEAWQIKDWLDSVPDHSKISVSHYKGDQREPQETTLTATWNPKEST